MTKDAMKSPPPYGGGILHFFSGIPRSTLLRSMSLGGSAFRIHPRPNSRGLLRRRIKNILRQGEFHDKRINFRSGVLGHGWENYLKIRLLTLPRPHNL